MSKEQTKSSGETQPASELLSPAEAAHFLGVTPELLFAYAIHPPKIAIGDDVTLSYTTKGECPGFLRANLVAFDNYLRKPWSEIGAPRPSLPPYIGDYLKVECGGQCARCGKGYKLENAHIVPFAESRSHHHHNLIRLCVECHEEFETKRLIPYGEIHELKQQLIASVRKRLNPCIKSSRSELGRMPNPALLFVGREHDLGELVEALSRHRLLSIEGPGGIGKTQLLLNALNLGSDPRPVLWMNLEAYKNVYDLKLALASALSDPGSSIDIESIADALADAGVRLVFDGVEQMSPGDMDEVEDFFGALLATTSAPQLIFTSQVELINLDLELRLQLGPISEEASLFVLQSAFVSELRRIAGETEGLYGLVEFCQGHPLSLQITAGLLRYFGSASTVMERIRRSGAAAIQNPTRSRQNTHTSLFACLIVSYQTLTTNQRKLLWLASQCPAGFLADMTKNSTEYGIEDCVADTAALRRWHLVDVEVGKPFGPRLHVLSPIRAFVKFEFQAEKPQEVQELEILLATELTAQAGVLDMVVQIGDVKSGLADFSIELPNFMHALRTSLDQADKQSLYLATLMASSLMVYCFVRGFMQRGIEIMHIGADAAIRIGEKDRASDMLTRSLSFAARSFALDDIQATAKELANLADGSSDPLLIANAHFGGGTVAWMEERLNEAGKAFAAAAIVYEKICQSVESKLTQTAKSESEYSRTDGALHMLSMALMGQGDVHLEARRPAEALPYYERALILVRKGNDQINVGCIMHQIGNCYANSNQGERALDSYLAAARQFQSIQFEEYLSNSLDELGYLLMEWDPPSSVDELLPEKLITDGLYDTARQVERYFTPVTSVPPSKSHFQTVRKTFGITALASFSSHNHLLADWAYDLREKVLRPLLDEVEWSATGDSVLLVMHLDLTLALAGTLSTVEQPKAMGPRPTMTEIDHLARLCYKYSNWGWTAFHPFEWLATYLRRHRGTKAIEPSALLVAAEEAEESGREISIVI